MDPPNSLIALTEIPASFGVHGPGEITKYSGALDLISFILISSFL